MTMEWTLLYGQQSIDMLGFIPSFLSEDDPRPAREQFNANYIGGWHPFKGFTRDEQGNLQYPGDPPTRMVAHTMLRDEAIMVYEHVWVLIVQPDDTVEISRMD